jgi:hypothetical protein
LIVKYPDAPLVRLRLEASPEGAGSASTLASFPMVDFLTSATVKGRHQKLSLVSIQIGETQFRFSGRIGVGFTPPNEDADEASASPVDVGPPPETKPGMPGTPPTEPAPRPTTQPSATLEPPIPRLSPPKLPMAPPMEGPKLFP